MFSKKIAFSLISFVTLSASPAMAQVGSQVGVINQDANTVNTAVNGTAISNTQQEATQFLNQYDSSYFGVPGSDSQLGVIQQGADTVNTAIDGTALSNTQQEATQFLNQGFGF
jgi:hypothetical protein